MATTVTMSGPGTTTIVEDAAAAIILQTAANEKLWGTAGLAIPGSPISMMQVQAQSLNDMASIMASMMENQKDIAANLSVIQTALAGLTVHVANGVTTSQVAVADQIKNNKFSQQTTNAALERSELPPTVVEPGDLLTTIQTTVSDVTVLKAQTEAASLVETTLTKGMAWTVTQAGDLVTKGWVASGGPELMKKIKAFFNITDPEVKKTQAELAAITRAAKTVGPPPAKDPVV